MRIVKGGARTAYKGRFTGPAELEMLAEAADAGRPDVARVYFDALSVTKWHSHPDGQILYVLEGKGRVGNDGERVALSVGDVVVAPPNERHWHGAATEKAVFLAITWGTTSWEDEGPDLGSLPRPAEGSG